MSDIIGMQGFGGGQLAIWQPPENPRPAVPEVSRAENDGSATFTRDQDLRGQNGSESIAKGDTAAAREAQATSEQRAAYAPEESTDDRNTRKDARNDENVIAGPTPAFQASVLEVERDLRNVIAKVEARRTRQADEAAIAPRAPEASEAASAASRSDPSRTAQGQDATAPATATKSAQIETPTPDPQRSDAPTAQAQPTDPAAAPSGPAAHQPTPYETNG
ncbi:hypothetical protein [Celeribacter sp.]|uniref:hypothetical protein n=1 Tax=Celeribacter sp. TaxID=1890673 RepID=UPI003A8F1B1D